MSAWTVLAAVGLGAIVVLCLTLLVTLNGPRWGLLLEEWVVLALGLFMFLWIGYVLGVAALEGVAL